MDNRFTDIIQLIKQSRTNAIKAVNSELINLYWSKRTYRFVVDFFLGKFENAYRKIGAEI